MKKLNLLCFMFFLVPAGLSAQQQNISFTFSAVNNTEWARPDSIRIVNQTRICDTVLYYPDTILVLTNQVGITDKGSTMDGFRLLKNYPNPAAGHTNIALYIPEKDEVIITLADITGQVKYREQFELRCGVHEFRCITGENGMCFFNAQWRENQSCLKIITAGTNKTAKTSVEYLGMRPETAITKAAEAVQHFQFGTGDRMLYTCYSDSLQSGIIDFPEANRMYTFQFATNIPCPGTPVVDYEGQIYNTIQVFSQCWLKENLNVGEMINGTMEQSNNGTIEKYCYNNQPDSCAKHGGLYQWDEMMQYTTGEINRGICPPGWHLPTDEEWKLLEGAADSQYGIGDTVWDNPGWRGEDAGYRLRKNFGWNCPGTDEFGFGSRPTGMREEIGIHNDQWFHSFGNSAYYWSTTQNTQNTSKIYHYLPCIIDGAGQGVWSVPAGMSVRCIKDL